MGIVELRFDVQQLYKRRWRALIWKLLDEQIVRKVSEKLPVASKDQ